MGLNGPEGAVRVIAYVVSGVGFLGAGVILREGLNIRGLNTAATLWCSAAVGACAGADMVAQALLLTIFVMTGNTVLRRLVNRINRIPFDERTSEATYELRITSDPVSVGSVRESVIEQLDQAHYPAREIAIEELGDGSVQLIAILAHMSINPDELNAVVERIKGLPGVRHAAWEMRASG
jgi:putative Mg2+ transporter-C (MgtC) family protein